jgi:hypothetical protein
VAAFRVRAYAADANAFQNYFHSEKHTFTLTFGLTDKASGASGTLALQGKLSGLGLGVGFAQANGAFTDPASQSVQLGEHVYTVTVSPFAYAHTHTAFPPPWDGPYQDVQVSVSVSDVPEPSALALGALGLPAVLTLARRQRGGLVRGASATA